MIGKRIKQARKKAGLSLRGLADALEGKVTAQAIGKYERGEMVPSSGVLIALSKAMDVSMSYLLSPQQVALEGVDFRKKANTSASDRARVEVEVMEWVERYIQIEQILGIDGSAWKESITLPHRITAIEETEELANKVRREWNLGMDPIPNMTELLEEKGLKVLTSSLPENVFGFTCMVRHGGGGVPVIVVNNQCTLERRRLTLAHELGHRVIDPINLASPKQEESTANYFAGAFLMPREHLEQEIGKHRHALGYEELLSLKRMYRVSAASLLVRLKNIEVIDEVTLTRCFQTFARDWRIKEPNPIEAPECRGQREQARRFERLCYRALAEGIISVPKAAELLRKPIPAVEEGLRGPSPKEESQ